MKYNIPVSLMHCLKQHTRLLCTSKRRISVSLGLCFTHTDSSAALPGERLSLVVNFSASGCTDWTAEKAIAFTFLLKPSAVITKPEMSPRVLQRRSGFSEGDELLMKHYPVRKAQPGVRCYSGSALFNKASLTRQQLKMIWCYCVKNKPAAVKTKAIIVEMQALVHGSVHLNCAAEDHGILIVAFVLLSSRDQRRQEIWRFQWKNERSFRITCARK